MRAIGRPSGRRHRLIAAAACCALAASAAAGGDSKQDTKWPWGAAPSASAAGETRRDLYNLGILGAKASDADRAPPETPTQSGQRAVAISSDPAADAGPDRLRVEVLYPDGPADKAGLRAGDVVTGVAGAPFKGGSIAPLAKAIVDAESGSAKGVALTVDRPKGPVVVTVTVPAVGKPAATPLHGKARTAQVRAALDWLADRQSGDGGFEETLSGKNGSVVQAAVAGLAWLAGGSELTKGPHAANIKKAVGFVTSNAGVDDMRGLAAAGASWNQTTWGYAHAAIFLGEIQSRTPTASVGVALRNFGDVLAQRQEGSGGWAHGPGGRNALGYIELNIVSGLSLMGMGAARQAGWQTPAAMLTKARKYIEESSGEDGGVGYSTEPGQQGMGNIGRTAAAWMGYSALGLGAEPWTAKMAEYVKTHGGDVFDGHASLMQHFLLAGLASQTMGGDAAKAYWKSAEANLVLARSPDGSFQPRPWHESLAMSSNSDVTFGEVWSTAAWAIVLAADGKDDGLPGLPAATGRLQPKPPKPK
jgi:hypothetical protein